MSDFAVVYRDPREIAAEINAIKRSTATYVLSQSIEIGRLLCEAKETVAHGEWGTWLAENCDYSPSNANNLMRIYQEYGEQDQLDFFAENKLELFGNLTRSQAVALLALPKGERAGFVQANDVEGMSTRDFEKAVAEAKERIEKEAEEKLAERLSEAGISYEKEMERLKEQAAADVEKAMEEKKNAENRAVGAEKEAAKLTAEVMKAKSDIEAAVKGQKQIGDLLKQKSDEADVKERRIAELEKLLEDAEETDPEKVEQLVQEALEKKLAETEDSAKAELETLRAENEKLKKAADPTVQKFMGLFEAWQEDWNRMQKVLSECTDTQTSEKLKAALGKMIDVMKEKV